MGVMTRIARLEEQVAELKETLASVAGKLLATDAVAPAKRVPAKRTAKKA